MHRTPRSPLSCRPILAIALLGLLATGCRDVSRALRPKPSVTNADLFGSDLVARTAAELEKRVGSPLVLLDLAAENGTIRFQVQDPAHPENVDQYELRDGTLQGPAPVQLIGPGSLAASLYPLRAVDLGRIPEFVRAALARLDIPEATPTSLRIQVDDPPGAIQRRIRGERVPAVILIRFYADSARKKGMVDADANFAILKATVF